MLTLLQNVYTARASNQKHGTANILSSPDSSNGAFGMNVGGGSNPLQVETTSIFDTLTWTSVPVSKMNAVAYAQLTFQTLTLLQKYPIMSGLPHCNWNIRKTILAPRSYGLTWKKWHTKNGRKLYHYKHYSNIKSWIISAIKLTQ